jgi:predicted aspartyl protease
VPAYDLSVHPPAPVAEVSIAHPVNDVVGGPLRGKLDTGADVTVIPERFVAQLGLRPRASVWVRSYDGAYSQCAVYYVRFFIEGHELPAVRCLATDRNDVLVGRNVLNRFVLTLDGKRLSFRIRPA